MLRAATRKMEMAETLNESQGGFNEDVSQEQLQLQAFNEGLSEESASEEEQN